MKAALSKLTEAQIKASRNKVYIIIHAIIWNDIKIQCSQMDQLAAQMEESRDSTRTIVHVDMDAFYAAVEMRDAPELK